MASCYRYLVSALLCCCASAAHLRLHQYPVNSSSVATLPAVSSSQRGHFSSEKAGEAPCRCETFSTHWKKVARTQPECLFIDLGAADGETYKAFLGTSSKWTFAYDTGAFKKENCYAYLIEANPRFDRALESFRSQRTYPIQRTASYMCDKQNEQFWLDVSGEGSEWGSSLNSTHEAVNNKKKTQKPVNVELFNLNRLLLENAIPEDTVVVKMDIEGAEYDILPCLADSPAANLIDTLYLEDHCPGKYWCPSTGQAGNSKKTFNLALEKLRKRGVAIPDGYWSPM